MRILCCFGLVNFGLGRGTSAQAAVLCKLCCGFLGQHSSFTYPRQATSTAGVDDTLDNSYQSCGSTGSRWDEGRMLGVTSTWVNVHVDVADDGAIPKNRQAVWWPLGESDVVVGSG